MMDSEEFTSGSSDDSDRAESSGTAAARALDVARVVRAVEPPLTRRTRERYEAHSVPAQLLMYYAVHEADLCNPDIDLAQYHRKLLTDVDVAHMFRGTTELRSILVVELARGAYLVLLAGGAHADALSGQVATVQAAPCVSEALALLEIGFALGARFPDETMRVFPLNWTLSQERDQLLLELADPGGGEILVVSADEDDLVLFDVHFTRAGVCLPDFVVMRASMTVGAFGRAVQLDKVALQQVLDRLYTPAARFVTNAVPLESYARAHEDEPDPADVRRRIPAMAEVPLGTDPRTLMVSARHYTNTEDYAFSRAAPPDARWQNVTKTYRTTDGWYRMIPDTGLNRSVQYCEAELHCGVHVNLDDSVHEAARELTAEAQATLRARHLRHCQTAAPKIVQMSHPPREGFSDAEDVVYLTTDEGHVRAVERLRKGKARRGADTADDLFVYCYVIHRYRTMFDPAGFANITIPPAVAAEFASNGYFTYQLEVDKIEMEQYVSRHVIDGLLAREAASRIPRTVHLRNWRLQCPVKFVGASLTKMIDVDVYRSIWERHQREHAEIQRIAGARAMDGAAQGVLGRLAVGAARLFGACSGRAGT